MAINKILSFIYLLVPIILISFSIFVFINGTPISNSWDPKSEGFNLSKIIFSNFVHENIYHISLNIAMYVGAIIAISLIDYSNGKEVLGIDIAIISLLVIFIVTPISGYILSLIKMNDFVVYGFSCVSYAAAGLFIYKVYKLDMLKQFMSNIFKLNFTLPLVLIILLTIPSFKEHVDTYGHLLGLFLGIVYTPAKVGLKGKLTNNKYR